MIPLPSVFLQAAINVQPSVKTIKLFSFLLTNELEREFVHRLPVNVCLNIVKGILFQRLQTKLALGTAFTTLHFLYNLILGPSNNKKNATLSIMTFNYNA
jgi:hypothetical protein